MSVTLEGILFNHDTTSANADALSIRRNATETVFRPEWRRGVSVSPEDSPAAYSIEDTRGNTLTIQANFRRDGGPGTVEVRAVDSGAEPLGPPGCMGILLLIYKGLVKAATGNVLGSVRQRTVTFGAHDETGFQTFALQDVRLWDVGVGARTTTWTWQYREKGGPWIDMATTHHRIYSVLNTPTAPWAQAPFTDTNEAHPWTEVLDQACTWAALSMDTDTAAAAVTRRVYNLGPSLLTYDCAGAGGPAYALGAFNCTAFLERLHGGEGMGEYVNCSDCAAMVSTFANAVGCDLWQARMGYSFGLNPMLGIGSNQWVPCCEGWDGWDGSFWFHEVAWKGACGVDDAVFDACLKVDGDDDPTAPPHAGLLPANLRFGNPGDGDYRDRLATPLGRPNCNPVAPLLQQRRALI